MTPRNTKLVQSKYKLLGGLPWISILEVTKVANISKQGGYLMSSAGGDTPDTSFLYWYIFAFQTHAGFVFLATDSNYTKVYLGGKDNSHALTWKEL